MRFSNPFGGCHKHGSFAMSLSGICQACEQERYMGMLQGNAMNQWAQYQQISIDPMTGTRHTTAFAPLKLPQSTVVTAIVAWRKWKTVMFGDGLYSINSTFLWEPRKKAISTCDRKGKCDGLLCGCGIHAFKERRQVEREYNPNDGLIGEVYLWGRVLECEHGYRAQFAYPKSFIASSPFADTYAAQFGIKVIGESE